jgi:DegV family protein with EDD domain
VTGRTGKKIHLFNSKTLTGGLGLIVLRVARAIEEGKTVEEIVPKIDEWIGKSHLRVTVPTLKYIIRSGRVSPFKSFVARMLDLKPVIAIDQEGKSYMFSKSFTTAASMKKVVKNISRMLNGKKIWEYAIMHANNPEAADWYSAEMEKLTGQKPAFVDHVSPVLAANIGEGVVGVALMLE